MDIIYLGNKQNEAEFRAEFSKTFPTATIEDASDYIHECRLEIGFKDEQHDEVMKWLVKSGWGTCSFNIQLAIMDPKCPLHAKIVTWINEMKAERLAKQTSPQ